MCNHSDSNIRVTVGLCVKNAERTIRNCVLSITNQSYPKQLVTLIVVDGKSKDKTVEIIKEQLQGSEIITNFYSDDGKGLGIARQMVLDTTQDKYIVWADGDTAIHEDFVEKQVEFMEANPRVCVATGICVHEKKTHASIPESLCSIRKYASSIAAVSKQATRGFPPNDVSIYRVDALKQVGGFDKEIRGASEDEDIIIRMRQQGWVVKVNKQALYHLYPRLTWQDLWTEQVWFGYGKHFLSHKYKDLHFWVYNIPLVYFYLGLKQGFKAYRLTCDKKSYLLSLRYFFAKVALSYGFIKAHLDGYGH